MTDFRFKTIREATGAGKALYKMFGKMTRVESMNRGFIGVAWVWKSTVTGKTEFVVDFGDYEPTPGCRVVVVLKYRLPRPGMGIEGMFYWSHNDKVLQ